MASPLSIREVRKTFGKAEILKGIDLEIDGGEFLILVGPSGCGKSTLLNLIAGLEAPGSGSIHLGGREITRLPSKDRDIAMVFQSYALYPNMTVAQNIAFALEMRGMQRAAREARVREVARLLQLEPLLERKPGALSGGQRQRVAMGRALAREPRLFLFDEPLSNLDAKLRVEMRAEIKLLHQRTRTSTVYVTHDQVEALTLGDRIAVMNGGRVEQFGTPDDIYARPATRFVAEFIGSPAMNVAAFARAEELAGWPLTPAQQAAPSNTADGLAYGVRPEHLRLSAQPGLLRGRLLLQEPTGPDTYARVQTAHGPWTARLASPWPGAIGDDVGLDWLPEHVHLFSARGGERLG